MKRNESLELIKGMSYAEKLKVYELLLALRQNRKPAATRPA